MRAAAAAPARRRGRGGRGREAAVTREEPRPGGGSPETLAFEALYRSHGSAVAGLCRRLLGPEAGRDASHEVFLRAQRGFAAYDPARPFRGWVLAIASHHCIDQLRRRGLEAQLFEPGGFDAEELRHPGPSPLRQALRSEESGRLRDAIDALPPRYRLPLVLRYFQELDYDAIGELLGLTRAQVATLLFRAKRRLREALAPGGPA
jgi:RNA polymerase sigma-70 factor (ECF subfamily)